LDYWTSEDAVKYSALCFGAALLSLVTMNAFFVLILSLATVVVALTGLRWPPSVNGALCLAFAVLGLGLALFAWAGLYV
jgi:hypothetical protein